MSLVQSKPYGPTGELPYEEDVAHSVWDSTYAAPAELTTGPAGTSLPTTNSISRALQ
jgi:hypothetical protein